MSRRSSRSTTVKRSAPARQSSAVKRSNGAKRANGGHPGDHRATYRPARKTVAATIGAAVSGIATYYANRAWPGTVTPEIAGMVTVVATFALGWIVPPGAQEAVVKTARGHRMASA